MKGMEKLLADPVKLGIGLAILAGGLYLLTRGALKDAAGAVGGLVSGDNAITRGTPYQGAGLPGTVGAVTNAASGGVLERFGGWLGRTVYDATHADYDPNEPTPIRADERTFWENLLEKAK